MDSKEALSQPGAPQESTAMDLPGLRDETTLDSGPATSPRAIDSSHMYPDPAYGWGSVDGSCDGDCDGCDCCSDSLPSEPYGGPEPPEVIIWEPFLTSFTLFLDLPVEVQDMIWHHTLKPRTVELKYSLNSGFFTRAKTPMALRVCPQSRNAVTKMYPLSFGSLLHKPNIVFNFSLDTLYFDGQIQPRLTQFLVSMTKLETENIQYIAVDEFIDEDFYEVDYVSEDDAMKNLKMVSHAMPALKEVSIVISMDRYSDEPIPYGPGPIVLSKEIPFQLQLFIWECGSHLHSGKPFSDYVALPAIPGEEAKGFEAKVVSHMFGWRPTDLPEVTPFWFDY